MRLRRFELVSGVLKEGGVVSVPGRPKYLVLAKFECGEGRVEGVQAEVEGWVTKSGLASAEVQWYGAKKVWVEGEVRKEVETP